MVLDREAWRTEIHGVAKSRTRLSEWIELIPLWIFWNWSDSLHENKTTLFNGCMTQIFRQLFFGGTEVILLMWWPIIVMWAFASPCTIIISWTGMCVGCYQSDLSVSFSSWDHADLFCWGPAWGTPPMAKSWGRRLDIRKGGIEPQESPWKSSSIYPRNQSLPTLLLCALSYTSDFTGGCSPDLFQRRS